MNKIIWLACLLFLAGLTVMSKAADQYKWIGQVTEDGASLSYAIPDSDAIRLELRCERRSGRIVVTLEHEPVVAKTGVMVGLSLQALGTGPKDVVRIRTTGQRLELGDTFILQGETRMSAVLRRILMEGRTLVVSVEDGSEEIPLSGAAQAARQLLASCP